MKPIRPTSRRYRYWFPVALLCAGGGFMAWQGSRDAGRPAQPIAAPAPSAAITSKRAEMVDPQILVAGWQEAGRAADSAPSMPGITLSSPPSPARAEAFRKLLAALTHENVAGIFALLHEAESPPREEEWQAFLEKWGRMDGARAAAALESRPDGGRWLPGLLRAWASVEPEAAVAWLEDPGQIESRSAWQAAAERDLVVGWLKADPGGAAAWLNAHRADPGHAAATAAFAKEVAAFDPENAAEWAHSIEGPWQHWAQEALRGENPTGEEGYDLLAAPRGDPASLPGIQVTEPE